MAGGYHRYKSNAVMGGREKRVREIDIGEKGHGAKATLLLYYFMEEKDVSIKINEALKWRLKEIATKEKTTIKAIVEDLVVEYVNKRGVQKRTPKKK